MQRESLSLEIDVATRIDNSEPPDQPCIIKEYDGKQKTLRERFQHPDGAVYTANELDFYYRFQPVEHSTPDKGVFVVAVRATGRILIEITVSPEQVDILLSAIRQYTEMTGDDPQYRVAIRAQNQQIAAIEKEIFLIYSADGQLIRHRSLIPDEIEI